jgi:hypothetical protein
MVTKSSGNSPIVLGSTSIRVIERQFYPPIAQEGQIAERIRDQEARTDLPNIGIGYRQA